MVAQKAKSKAVDHKVLAQNTAVKMKAPNVNAVNGTAFRASHEYVAQLMPLLIFIKEQRPKVPSCNTGSTGNQQPNNHNTSNSIGQNAAGRPSTLVVGPFHNKHKPLQCYKCEGWGHFC